MKIKNLFENTNKKSEPPKPRNFVAKNAAKTTSGAGAHRDKKKEQKQGYEKHKGKEVAEEAAGVGIVTKQNATVDVPVGGEYMNVKKLFPKNKKVKEQNVGEGNEDDVWGPQGRFAGDKHVDIGGVSFKPISVGDLVKYFGEPAHVVALSKDKTVARITSKSGDKTLNVKTSDLKQLEKGVAEGGVLKFIKRGLKGWQGSSHLDDIQDYIRNASDKTLVRLYKDPGESPYKQTPRDIQIKLINRELKRRYGIKPGEQGVSEGEQQVYKVVALTKSNALAKPTKMKVKADSIEEVFERLAANDWYPLEINGVEVIAGKRLKQGVAEESELGDLAHQTTLKHRFLVTYSDPNHTMVTKRKERLQKHVLAPSTNKNGESVFKGEVEPLVKKHMNKQGFRVHEIEHVGMVSTKVNAQGVKEGSKFSPTDDVVGFTVNSEKAYNVIMRQFGDYIDFDEDEGVMYVPEKMWPKVEMAAFDADGEGATKVDDDGTWSNNE